MIQALINIIIRPKKALDRLSCDSYLQNFMPLLLVFPLLLLAALSSYCHHLYGFISAGEATKEAIITLMKMSSCILCGWVIIVLLGRYYYASQCNKRELFLFTSYAYTITLLSIIAGNILPSDFAFIQFAPMYIVWIVYQGRKYVKIPEENTFSYIVTTSAVLVGMPYVWEKFFNILLH